MSAEMQGKGEIIIIIIIIIIIMTYVVRRIILTSWQGALIIFGVDDALSGASTVGLLASNVSTASTQRFARTRTTRRELQEKA